MSVDPVIATTLRSLLALLFACAAWHKLADFPAFRIVLHDYRVLPLVLVAPATVIAVAAEILLAVVFPWQASAPLAASTAIVLLGVYSVAIAVNLGRGRRTLECGCAPSAYRQPLSEWLLLRNGLLIGACVLALLPVSARPWAWADWLTLLGAVAVGASTWTAAQRLLALATPPLALRGVER